MGERVLVTGAAGFVGRHLVPTLVERGDDVVATDVAEPPDRYADLVDGPVGYSRGDVTDGDHLDRLLDDDYDRLYHLAAVVGVDQYVENPLRLPEVNIGGTKAILERVAADDVRFVFTSTSEIYGKNPSLPWDEESDRVLGPPTIDRWSYSTGKSVCEHMIHGLSREREGFTATVVRPFNLYGPGQRPKFVVPAFVDAVVDGDLPTVYDDGTQTRCFTFVDDFIEGLIAASVDPAGADEAFNLGRTEERSILEVAETVLAAAGMDDREPEHIDTDELYGDRYEDLQRRVPDATKARQRLGWTADTPLDEGVERTLDWARDRA